MKTLLIVPAVLLGMASLAQAPSPTLSTSDRVALSALEQQKQAAQKQYSDAEQQELAILREWGQAHSGWHINQQTFAVEADVKPSKEKATTPAATKPEENPAEPKKP